MPLQKNHPEHPSSNFETGIRHNFPNILAKWVIWGAWALSGVWAWTSGLALIGSWAPIIWLLLPALLSIGLYLSLLPFLERVEDQDMSIDWDWLHLDEDAGCVIGLIVLVGTIFTVPLLWIFSANPRRFRNRFVWWRGGAYLYREHGKKPQEIETYNPLLLTWLYLFRRADQFDEHARLIDEKILKDEPLGLPAPKQDLLDDFPKIVQETLHLEFQNVDDSWIRQEDHFLELIQQLLEAELTPAMKEHARRAHKRKVENES